MKVKSDGSKNQSPPKTRRPDRLQGTAWLLGLWLLTTIVWAFTLFGQPIAEGIYRWTLFLVPDQAIAGWFDGPVTFSGLVDRFYVACCSTAILAISAGTGYLSLRGTSTYQRLRISENLSVCIAFGLILHSNVLLLVGLAGWLRSPWAPLLVPVATLTAGFLLGRTIHSPRTHEKIKVDVDTQATIASQDLLPRSLAIVFSLLVIAKAILPPAEYDVREYHLQAPKEWWLAGGIDFLPHNIYANMPMAAEIHSLTAIMTWSFFGSNPATEAWWWGALSGKLLIAGYAILMGIVVGAAVRLLAIEQEFSTASSLTASRWCRVVAISFPAIVEGASLGLNESAIACNFAVGLLVLFVALQANSNSANFPSPFETTALISLAAGGAIACKYTAVALILPVLFGLWLYYFSHRITPKLLIIWPVMLIVGGGIWYFKNGWLAGNPVYPLAANVLGGETLNAEKIAQWNAGHATPATTFAALQQSVADLLWKWRLQGWVTLPLVILGTATLATHRSRQLLYSLTAAAGFTFFVWWLATHRVDRFLIPVLPLAFVFAGLGLAKMFDSYGRKIPASVLSILLLFNFIYVAGPALGDSRILVSLNYLRSDDLTESSITRLPVHVRWVNKNLQPEDRILVVGDAAVFDFESQITYSTTFDRSPLAELTSSPTNQWSKNFESSPFNYLLVHWGEIERLRSTYGFDEAITGELIEKLTRLKIIIPIDTGDSDGRWNIYRIRRNPLVNPETS